MRGIGEKGGGPARGLWESEGKAGGIWTATRDSEHGAELARPRVFRAPQSRACQGRRKDVRRRRPGGHQDKS